MKNKIFIALAFIIANIAIYWLHFSWDLTDDKRFTLSDASINILSKLEDKVEVDVYLNGSDLPGGFERLKRKVEQTLESFNKEASKQVKYSFIDPNAGDETARKETMNKLVAKGMQPTNIFDNKGGKKTQVIVFPYAVIKYKGKESTILLLKGNMAENAQTRLNQSAEVCEHTLISGIQKMVVTEKKKIALLAEFTSLKPVNFGGIINALQEYYQLYILDSKTSPSFEGIDAIILPKPDKPISEETKLKLDQYLMKGGKILFFVDGLQVDSVGLEGSFAKGQEINLDDMLFKYGVRINKNIVKDGLNAAVIPLVVGNMGDKPNFQPVPYRYFPLINNFGNSIITKNIDMVMTKYTSNIDFVNTTDGLQKTPLLNTSPYTKILTAPALITFNEARTDTDEKEYTAGVKCVASMVEGEFESLYANRMMDGIIKKSTKTKILVCADGDVIVNDIDQKTNNPFPLGFDKYTQHQYGNQDFIINALNYMLDEGGVLSTRAKSFQIRPLDNLKLAKYKTGVQIFNILVPLALVFLLGFFQMFFYRKKYSN